MKIALSYIDNNSEFNCRGKVDGVSTEWLQKSIAAEGLLQPILVRPIQVGDEKTHFRIVAGFSRYMACKMLGWTEIECTVIECDDVQAAIKNLVENIARKDLTLEQEARGIEAIMNRNPGITRDQIADQCQMSIGWVQLRQQLLRLPKDIQLEFTRATLPFKYVTQLSQMTDIKEQYAAVRYLKDMIFRQDNKEVILRDVINPERAEKEKIEKQKEQGLRAKQARSIRDMHMMNEHLIEKIGPCLATQILAWCSCDITSSDFFHQVKEYADIHGITYTIPQEEVTQTR